MRIRPMPAYERMYERMPVRIQELADKQLALLAGNPRHPSLDLKHRRGSDGIWTLRVTRDYRIVLRLTDGDAYLAAIGKHDVTDRF
jgi:mRNA-degrading endonuclease RelE of RelBE toxin-antitoxin system